MSETNAVTPEQEKFIQFQALHPVFLGLPHWRILDSIFSANNCQDCREYRWFVRQLIYLHGRTPSQEVYEQIVAMEDQFLEEMNGIREPVDHLATHQKETKEDKVSEETPPSEYLGRILSVLEIGATIRRDIAEATRELQKIINFCVMILDAETFSPPSLDSITEKEPS